MGVRNIPDLRWPDSQTPGKISRWRRWQNRFHAKEVSGAKGNLNATDFSVSCREMRLIPPLHTYRPWCRFHYKKTWVAMNFKPALPTPESHPEFPLWKLDLTPEDIYNHFIPENFRFLCNPNKPAICSRFGLPEDRLWRFEYVVRSDEDGTEMASVDNVKKVVFPYLNHWGQRYVYV